MARASGIRLNLQRHHDPETEKAPDHVLVKLSGGRIAEATRKAIVDTSEGVRLQVSFGEETALIYLWQIVIEPR